MSFDTFSGLSRTETDKNLKPPQGRLLLQTFEDRSIGRREQRLIVLTDNTDDTDLPDSRQNDPVTVPGYEIASILSDGRTSSGSFEIMNVRCPLLGSEYSGSDQRITTKMVSERELRNFIKSLKEGSRYFVPDLIIEYLFGSEKLDEDDWSLYRRLNWEVHQEWLDRYVAG